MEKPSEGKNDCCWLRKPQLDMNTSVAGYKNGF